MAERITEEEAKRDSEAKKEAMKVELDNAREVKNMIEKMEIYKIKKKVGANGQLFGGVKYKDVIEIVQGLVPSSVATNKYQVIMTI